ncbi:protein-S-isoprenylcysteine O-methyltransferase [Leptospira sarikeiensis]|uniref:Isoprenylcysteine carboxylmethyltransferase family protein n=1 Tax=Leptospira sarikeiensis TaxID=2484943 RepID=A0A4R9KE65_9LEPT|nr:protein-S-isoprenylcysteine O-methyltransferase [Leptospira sarikeiensis]TGL64611.1 isoprenylcysteine carboxylmethyltransferase family protein [Leptospira sarikeiensis]
MKNLHQDKTGIIFLFLTILLFIGTLWRLFSLPWSNWIWLTGFLITFFIRAPHAKRNQENTNSTSRHDGSEKLLLIGMFLSMSVLPLLHLATNCFYFANYNLPEWATYLGIVLQILYLYLFWRSHYDLGKNWSPGLEIRNGHTLVTNGIYSKIRHPMYSSIWLGVISQSLLIQNWIGGVSVILAFAFMYFLRVPKEEEMMKTEFGSEYEEYRNRTGKIWPKFG